MRVHEIMTKHVRAVAPDLDADAALQLMHQEHVHHLVVIEGKRVAGVISERDLGGEKGALVRAGRKVSDLMSREVVTTSPDETVRHAANLLRGNEIGCLPILDERGALVGILTTTDILDMVGKGMESVPREGERWTMHARGTKKEKQHRAQRVTERGTRAPRR